MIVLINVFHRMLCQPVKVFMPASINLVRKTLLNTILYERKIVLEFSQLKCGKRNRNIVMPFSSL